jgi:hypothetical protein
MNIMLSFKLVQKAKKSGGDKYQCESDETFIIYFPQTISRGSNGECKEKLNMTIQNGQNVQYGYDFDAADNV